MKTIRFAALFACGFAVAAMTPTTPAAAEGRQKINLSTSVPVQCVAAVDDPWGGARITLTNTTGATIPAGVRIDWTTVNAHYGHHVLVSALPPGGQVTPWGGSGPGYACSATMSSMADLVPWKAEWVANNTQVKVEVKDLDPWVGAEPSVVRVQVMSCGGQTLGSYDSAPFAVLKGDRGGDHPRHVRPGKDVPARHRRRDLEGPRAQRGEQRHGRQRLMRALTVGP